MGTKQKLWVILNAAMTVDGKIDTAERKGAKISSEADWARVDQLRAEIDAVMIGGHTLAAEDPRLTVRSPQLREKRLAAGLPENPAKVGIISDANLPLESRFLTDGGAEVYIFTTRKTSPDQIAALRSVGAKVHLSEGARVDLALALQHLKSAGISKLMLEGGGSLNAAMLANGLIDEVRLYIAPRIFGGASSPTLADGPGLSANQAVLMDLNNIEILPDGGILVSYLVK